MNSLSAIRILNLKNEGVVHNQGLKTSLRILDAKRSYPISVDVWSEVRITGTNDRMTPKMSTVDTYEVNNVVRCPVQQ